MNVFGRRKLTFTKPEFVLVYTGREKNVEEKFPNLSELYENSEEPQLELKVKVITGKDNEKQRTSNRRDS